ncbi:hypothetical protein [Paraclostridium bifermentans]|uniref:hypothetical protein n=1 Tax=Paraclostridium bifermentans TaxID=1490 RepID=UPI00374FA396
MTKYKEIVKEYKEILSKSKLTYNTHISVENDTDIYYTCSVCGFEGKINSSSLTKEVILECINCKNIKIQELKDLLKSKGKIVLKCDKVDEAEILHLYCGHKSTVYSENKNDYTCAYCHNDLDTIKTNHNDPKQIEEFDKLLKYVLDLVNEINKQNISLNSIPEFTDDIDLINNTIEYIEVWYNSFKEINNKYPKGNLINVLSNNMWYAKVWKEAVPVLEKLLGIEA